MKSKNVLEFGAGGFGLAVVAQPILADRASAQEHKPLMIHRLFAGPDGQTHAEEVEAKFSGAAAMTFTS